MRINTPMNRLHRSASIALETLLLLPVLLIVLLAVVELSIIVATNQRLAVASAQGARAAAQGADEVEIDREVRRALNAERFLGAEVKARVRDETGRPLRTGDQVEVIVEVPAEQAVPDLLRIIGLSLRGDKLSGRTALRKE